VSFGAPHPVFWVGWHSTEAIQILVSNVLKRFCHQVLSCSGNWWKAKALQRLQVLFGRVLEISSFSKWNN